MTVLLKFGYSTFAAGATVSLDNATEASLVSQGRAIYSPIAAGLPEANSNVRWSSSAGTALIKPDGTTTTLSGGSTIATDPLWNAAGDLAYGTGADTATRLPVGTAGQVLKVNAGATAPEWASASGSGSFGYLGEVATAADLVDFTEATIGCTANVGASAAAYIRYELKGNDPSVLADWQPLQGTIPDGTTITIVVPEGKVPRTLRLLVTSGQFTVTVGGVTQPVLVESLFYHEIPVVDLPGAAQPTSVTIQRTSGSSTTSKYSLDDGSSGPFYYGDPTTYALLIAAHPTPASLPSGTSVCCGDVGLVTRNVAGTAWVSQETLGPYTWAELQTAYPNNGAALLALPIGIRALVADTNVGNNAAGATSYAFRALFQPNPAQTLWMVTAPTRVYADDTASVGVQNTSVQILKQCKIPAKMLRAGGTFRMRFTPGKTGTTDATSSSAGVRVGSAGTTGDGVLRSVSAISAGNRSSSYDYGLQIGSSSTNLQAYGARSGTGDIGGSGNTVDPTAGVTINDSDTTDTWFSVCHLMAAATVDSPAVYGLDFWLWP